MKKLIERFSGLVKSSLSGFDRIVFKGFILPLMSAGEVLRFCRNRGILNKDYKSWMMAQTRTSSDTLINMQKTTAAMASSLSRHGVSERRPWLMNGNNRNR